MRPLKDWLEGRQIAVYFAAVAAGVVLAFLVTGTEGLLHVLDPALGFMLFVTFLQVPLAQLGQALKRYRFLAALMTANFVAIPCLVGLLLLAVPDDPLVVLGVLLVLLTPCIDYVVTFSRLGGADARLLLAATPALLIAQMALLPLYLGIFLDQEAAALVRPGPFLQAFLYLIVIPLVLAGLVQAWAARSGAGRRVNAALDLLPVPATALVLLMIAAGVVPELGQAWRAALPVVPVYLAFAALAPLLGWAVARAFRLEAPAGRAVAFSAGTRNSLVVLPLALAVPGAIPVLPAVIVTQTMVELLAELAFIRAIPRLGRSRSEGPNGT